MNNFVIRTKPSNGSADLPTTSEKSAPKKTSSKKSNFLTNVTLKFEANNKDVGIDILGDLKDNLENVVEFFDLVKELNNVKSELQQVQFGHPYPTKEYRLIELTPSLLAEFEAGTGFTFRGSADDSVVLCSRHKTFDVKEAETSNTLLITTHLTCAGEVGDAPEKFLEIRKVPVLRRHYLELKEMPVVSRTLLRDLLHESELRQPENDSSHETASKCRYSFHDLLERLQMSEMELRTALERMPVIEFQERLRWLSVELRSKVLSLVVDAMDCGTLRADELTFKALRGHLKETEKYPDALLHWLLHSHCRPVAHVSEGAEEDRCFSPVECLFVRTLALPILLGAKQISLHNFERRISAVLPSSMHFKVEYLEGLALQKSSLAFGDVLEYFNVEELTEDPRERLSLLFSRRDRWRRAEIEPFLADLTASPSALQTLLLQNCRSETDENGEKIFVSLKPL